MFHEKTLVIENTHVSFFCTGRQILTWSTVKVGWEAHLNTTKLEVFLIPFYLEDTPVSQLAVVNVCTNKELYSLFRLHFSKNKPKAVLKFSTVAFWTNGF